MRSVSRRRRGGSVATRKPWAKGMRVIIYIRVSKIGDRQDTLISDEVQEDVCRKWAEREGLVIIGQPVSDLDKTGREVTKRQIAKSIDRVRKGEADGIVVWKVSRWGRNLIDSMLNVAELQEAGGFIASATENLEEIETPMGKFSLTQMLAIAQLQSDQMGETWENIHDFRRDQGLVPSGGHRLGYTYAKGEKDPTKAYVANELTAPWIERCYREYVAGKPLSSLVTMLWENGVRSKNNKKISYRSLRVSMDSGFSAGLVVDRRDSSSQDTNPAKAVFTLGAHEPIISMSTWEGYVRRRGEKRAPREAAATHRLTGLVYCSSCEHKMTSTWIVRETKAGKVREQQLRCWRIKANKTLTGDYCPRPVTVRVSALESYVLAWLKKNYMGEGHAETVLARRTRANTARADVETIEGEIKRLRGRLSRLTDMLLDAEDDDEFTKQTFREKQDEIKSELQALRERKTSLEVEANVSDIPMPAAFGALVAAWEHADPAMLNESLRAVICRIYVEPGHGKEKRIRPVGRWETECSDAVLKLV